jgi:hypothetical protein
MNKLASLFIIVIFPMIALQVMLFSELRGTSQELYTIGNGLQVPWEQFEQWVEIQDKFIDRQYHDNRKYAIYSVNGDTYTIFSEAYDAIEDGDTMYIFIECPCETECIYQEGL